MIKSIYQITIILTMTLITSNNKTLMGQSVACDVDTGICESHKGILNDESEDKNLYKKGDAKLIYYFDALCGWCYGFSPVMSQVKEEYGDKLDIQVVSGGLFSGNRAGAINEVAPHIRSGAYKSVEQRTGVRFGESFLADVFGEGNMTLNSTPPTKALSIVKEKFPEKELEFASLLLKAVYLDGLDPIDIDGLSEYAVSIGFNKEEFLTKMKDDKYKAMVEKEIELFRSSKYAAMPALVLVKEGREHLISHGYTNFENIKRKLDAIIF